MEFLDSRERALIDGALGFIRQREPDAAAKLAEQVTRVENMAAVANSFPSMLVDEKAERAASVVNMLCQLDSGMSSISLPMRAVMGDAFLKAKAQMFQAFSSALAARRSLLPDGLLEAAEREVAQTIYTMLLAELLWDLVRDVSLPFPARQRAATEVVRVWETPDRVKIHDSFPVLEAVWKARNRVEVVYGTLAGVAELFQLVRGDCPPSFVSFFTRQDVSTAELAAFQEFLFGLPNEELKRLQDAMSAKRVGAIDRGFAEDTLKTAHTASEKTPEGLYASYRRRQSASKFRRLLGAPGPQRTAEGYMILHLLEADWRDPPV